MDLNIQFLRKKLLQESEEVGDLPGDQERIDVAESKGKITAADFKALHAKKGIKKEVSLNEDEDYDAIAQEEFGLDYDQLGPNEQEWVRDEAYNRMNEGDDHEVAMAHNSLESIIKSATELKMKLGNNERDIPGWIQDHITNAENYIDQAAQGFHELHN